MKRIIIYAVLLTVVCGCSLLNKECEVYYWYNDINEVLGPKDKYCIYDFMTPLDGRCDHEVHVAAHYQVMLPPKKIMKKHYKSYASWTDRCFIYSRNRGIAIFQDIRESDRKNPNGVRQILKDTVEDQLEAFQPYSIKVKGDRNHFIYVDGEIRIIMFNLEEKDYNSFINLPMNSLKIKRHAEVRIE